MPMPLPSSSPSSTIMPMPMPMPSSDLPAVTTTPPKTAPAPSMVPSTPPRAMRDMEMRERGQTPYAGMNNDRMQTYSHWRPGQVGDIYSDGRRDGRWMDGMDTVRHTRRERSSHFGAAQMGGPATNKHYCNGLRGGSSAFHDTSDKFVTSNEAFFGPNARFMPEPPPPRRDPNFRYVNGDSRQGVARWQKSENYRRNC